MGPNGRETVSRLSLYIKKEDVQPMAVNMPWLISRAAIDHEARIDAANDLHDFGVRGVEMRQLATAMEDKPNLKSPGNPIYWIWWTIGATLLVGAITLWSEI